MSAAPCMPRTSLHGRSWYQMPCHWDARATADLSPSARALLAYLAHYQRAFGPILLTNEELGGVVGLGTRQIQILLAGFVKSNWISREEVTRPGQRGRGRRITVLIPARPKTSKPAHAVSRIPIRESGFVKCQAHLNDSTCVRESASVIMESMGTSSNEAHAAAASSQGREERDTRKESETVDVRETIRAMQERETMLNAACQRFRELGVDEEGAEFLAREGCDVAFVEEWHAVYHAPNARFDSTFTGLVVGKWRKKKRAPEQAPAKGVRQTPPPRPLTPLKQARDLIAAGRYETPSPDGIERLRDWFDVYLADLKSGDEERIAGARRFFAKHGIEVPR